MVWGYYISQVGVKEGRAISSSFKLIAGEVYALIKWSDLDDIDCLTSGSMTN